MSNKRKLEQLKKSAKTRSSADVLWSIAQKVAVPNDKLSYLLGLQGAIGGLGLALLMAILVTVPGG